MIPRREIWAIVSKPPNADIDIPVVNRIPTNTENPNIIDCESNSYFKDLPIENNLYPKNNMKNIFKNPVDK